MEENGVHIAHCCLRHGCKYGDLDCRVALNTDKQEHPCEYCADEDHILITGFGHWVGASVPPRVANLIKGDDGYFLPLTLLKSIAKDYDVQLSHRTGGLVLMLDKAGGGHRQR
jgi:hypothetical protein